MGTSPKLLKTPSLSERASQLLREMKWALFAVLGLALLLMLVSYDPRDASFNHISNQQTTINNWVGTLGAWISDAVLYVFGLSAYWWVMLCALVIIVGYRRFFDLFLF
jgi:S-DNA-T family DNA segregation ATPase FtsK/SpoIIIE